MLEGCDEELEWNETREAIETMARRKAAGKDLIPGELLKLVSNEEINEEIPSSGLGRSIYQVMKSIWEEEMIPDRRNTSIVVPVPKKGHLSDPDSSRGISLIPVMIKLLRSPIMHTIITSIIQ